jgi:hypothetical protein
MPNYEKITAAREKANRIREYAVAFRRESARLEESTKDTRKSAIPVVIPRKSSLKTERTRPVGRVAA